MSTLPSRSRERQWSAGERTKSRRGYRHPYGSLPLRFGFPVHDPCLYDVTQCTSYIDALAGYIFRSIGAGGLPAYHLSPASGEYVRTGTAARVIHALFALMLAGKCRNRRDWTVAAARGISHCLDTISNGQVNLPDHTGGWLANAILLAAASECGEETRNRCTDLFRGLVRLCRQSGWIGSGARRLGMQNDHDYLPGALVWALALFCRASGTPLPQRLADVRRFYGNRFREYPTWGSPWLAQGWSAVHDITGDPADAEVCFAAASWACERQLEHSGAFLETMSPDEPSFNAGFIAEGIAGAWRAAVKRSEHDRVRTYEHCWTRAAEFLTTLTLHQDDVFPFRHPHRAVGGIRCTVSRSGISESKVSHALHALVEG